MRATWLLPLLWACGPSDDPKKDRHPTDPTPTTPTFDPFTGTPMTELPGSERVQSSLDGEELVQGENHALAVEGAPPGAEVTFLISEVGLGVRHCVPFTVDCAEILEPELWGSVVADDLGNALFTRDIPLGEPPRTVWFQAMVRDPATGDVGFTRSILRHVSVRSTDASTQLLRTTVAAGLLGVNTGGNSHTGGVAWVDYNNDLWPDLFVTNGANQAHQLFRNDGDGTFTRKSDMVLKPNPAIEDAGVSFADLDNDGDDDILVTGDSAIPVNAEAPNTPEGGPNQLYLNNGDGTFTESAGPAGLLDPDGHRNICATFADVDRDGWIDVHLGSWAMNSLPAGVVDDYDHTLRNQGGGVFADITATTGTDGYGRDVLACSFFDADRDGWQDLYLGHVNAVEPFYLVNVDADDVLYLNEGGTFRDATADSPGVGDDAWSAMGIDVGDVDNDGDFDLYVTDRYQTNSPHPRGNTFYLNNGDGTFQDNTCDEANVCSGYVSWPVSFADFDLDGWVDLFVGNTLPNSYSFLFVNDHDGTFTSHEQKDFKTHLRAARGGATADYDGDGDVDLAVTAYGSDLEVLANQATGNFVELKLVGKSSNRSAIGAVVELHAGALSQIRRVSGGDSAHSQSESIVHFGLGSAVDLDEIEITWPNGGVQVLADVPAGDLWIVDEDLGVVQETAQVTATWSAGALDVTATTNYGGRTTLTVAGLGDLTWDPELLAFVGSFAVDPAPDLVVVDGRRGAHAEVAPVLLP